ncbi:nucleotide sugar dehydrogenase [Streptomyces sp. B6B3]|uniref:nucleotide sugar dehydrogenase n=1 Tax=Streptomyces sp. B6B3 TaxID=3153570 RepID=UPI00325CDF1C
MVGLGYVGLPTALALRAAGRSVIGLDTSAARLDAIRAGRVDLLPADRERLRAHAGRPGFELTGDPDRLRAADAVLVCVPTPVDEHRVPDLRAVRSACATVVARAVPGQTLILASTSYVGTTRELLADPLAARGLRPGLDVFVACAPERIDPGRAAHPQTETPRVVGGLGPEAGRRAAEVLAPTAAGVHRVGSPEAAEMTKLLENTFRAVNIALANEVATACGDLGLEVMEVVRAAATKRFGFQSFVPGPGAGGHCIPCDPHYLLWQLRARRVATPLIDAAMTALDARPRTVVRRALDVLAERGVPRRGAHVLVVGVAYKPGVADVRESPALDILADLAAAGVAVSYTDPLIPSLTLPGAAPGEAGRRLRHVPHPATHAWDLVLVHVAHPDQDLSWLADQVLVLDATYRLDDVKHRAVV